jgi:AbrB family looped-hinge helix DNA binding protein
MVTFNGRITLPIDIRKQLGLKTGDNIEFVEIGDGRFAIRPCSAADASNTGEEEDIPAKASALRETVQ